jgi:hypothetical protein
MYTVEHMLDDTVVTTLDQGGEQEDVEVFFDAKSIIFRQWNDELVSYDLIEMSEQQLRDIIAAMDSPEGAYYAS